MKAIFEIFFTFMKIGCLTFGGGYAMLPVVERELIKTRRWVTMDEVTDYYTIAQVTPGIIAVNLSTFVGYKRGGAAGGIFATLGFISLPLIMVIIAGLFISNFSHLEIVIHAFAGIRIAVGALLLSTVVKMRKGAFADVYSVIICAASFLMSVIFSANPVVLVIAFGLSGFLLYSPRRSIK
jgi:chromate transporter